MHIAVDYEQCEGHARCVAVAPEVFDVGDDDLVVVRHEHATQERLQILELAVDSCPRQALRLTD